MVLRRNYGIREADGCSRTPPGAMLRRHFRCRRSFVHAAVSDINYIAERDTSWEKKSGSVAKLGLQYPVMLLCNIDRRIKRALSQWANDLLNNT